MITSTDGYVTGTTGVKLLDGPAGTRRINLYNPNGSAAGFILRKIVREANEERIIRQWDDSIPATDSWSHGALGGVLILQAGAWLELILDASPAIPIEYSIDYETDL